mgnify:CR=1 FL=1
MSGHIDPTRERFGEFRRLPDEGPVHMLNLVRLREWAAYPDGRRVSGRDAYRAYARESGPLFQRLGDLLAGLHFHEDAQVLEDQLDAKALAPGSAARHEEREVLARQYWGMTIEEIGLDVASRWGWPPQLLVGMRSLRVDDPEKVLEGDEYQRVLCTFANTLAEELMRLPEEGSPEERDEARKAFVLQYANDWLIPLGLNPETIGDIVNTVRTHWLELIKALGVTLTPGGVASSSKKKQVDMTTSEYRKRLAEDLADAVDELTRRLPEHHRRVCRAYFRTLVPVTMAEVARQVGLSLAGVELVERVLLRVELPESPHEADEAEEPRRQLGVVERALGHHARHRQAELLAQLRHAIERVAGQLGGRRGSQVPAGAVPDQGDPRGVHPDLGSVGVHPSHGGHTIVERDGKAVLGRLLIVDRDHHEAGITRQHPGRLVDDVEIACDPTTPVQDDDRRLRSRRQDRPIDPDGQVGRRPGDEPMFHLGQHRRHGLQRRHRAAASGRAGESARRDPGARAVPPHGRRSRGALRCPRRSGSTAFPPS